ncbi:MAG: RHS repeat-associated core domain-containing protein [Bacillota bacterium]
MLTETDPSGNNTYYIYGLGLIGQEENGSYMSYHYDLRGSTVALTDINGNVTDRFQYSAYGELVHHTGSTETPFMFNGLDGVITDANGLIYMRARYYNPELRRFLSKDPLMGSITEPQSLDAYGYCENDPVNRIDPSGEAFIDDFKRNFQASWNAAPEMWRASCAAAPEMWSQSCAALPGNFREALRQYVGPGDWDKLKNGQWSFRKNGPALFWVTVSFIPAGRGAKEVKELTFAVKEGRVIKQELRAAEGGIGAQKRLIYEPSPKHGPAARARLVLHHVMAKKR